MVQHKAEGEELLLLLGFHLKTIEVRFRNCFDVWQRVSVKRRGGIGRIGAARTERRQVVFAGIAGQR